MNNNRINNIKRFNELTKTNEEINWLGRKSNDRDTNYSKIKEGPTKTNQKFVNSERPNVLPAPQKPNVTPGATRSGRVWVQSHDEKSLTEQEKELLLKAIDHYENFKKLKFYNLDIVDSIKNKLNL